MLESQPEKTSNRLYYGDKEITPEELDEILAELDGEETDD